METLGHKLKRARLVEDLCQEYMADSLGITQAAYSKIESGQTQITVNRFLAICRLLHLDPKHMLEEQFE